MEEASWLFLSHLVKVFRETPKVRAIPRILETLLISPDDLFFTRFAIAEVRILSARLATRSTLVLLFAIRRSAVLDKLFATTVVALDVDHLLAYQFDLNHYQKKELPGNFCTRGRQWCREATAVNTHDFPSYATGQAVPYGLYDVAQNLGYVALSQSADTPELAVDALVWWWREFGRSLYPQAPELLVLADGGGSNGCRPRRWKHLLQVKLADAFGLAVTVCHYPTGASK